MLLCSKDVFKIHREIYYDPLFNLYERPFRPNGLHLKKFFYHLLKRLFSVFPPTTQFFWKICDNLIKNRLEYKLESFSFKFILTVIVQDSHTNFVQTFSLCSYAFLMQKSAASCFESSINTKYEHNYSQNV